MRPNGFVHAASLRSSSGRTARGRGFSNALRPEPPDRSIATRFHQGGRDLDGLPRKARTEGGQKPEITVQYTPQTGLQSTPSDLEVVALPAGRRAQWSRA